MNQQVASILLILGFVSMASNSYSSAVDQSDKLIWQQVANQCASFKQSIQTLASYLEFQANYDTLNKCLHLEEPPAACLEAEQQCHQNGLFYSGVKLLGILVRRAGSGKPTCNIEFASKIFRLHKQLAGPDGALPRLAPHLRTLANRWAQRCRASLVKRLQDIEERAPDTYKHVNLVANILNLGASVAEFQLEPEHYVPTLEEERALDEQVSSAGLSGFSFNTSKQIDTARQMLKISCKTLKKYHINLIGSIGLLASVSYAAPTSLNEDTQLERGRARAWIVSAMVCQLLRGVTRMSSMDSEGNARNEILVLPLQEADVSLSAEQDKTFASFGLPEAVRGRMELDLEGSRSADLYAYKDSGRLSARKMELINGPSYELASAIYTYLDLRQSNRMPMANTILGLH